jgi:spore germination cell wall hydrolase CwlJ-like protein
MIAVLSVLLAIVSPATAGEWISWAAPAQPDAKQVECMAKAIYFEAGNEPMAGRIAVAKVVLNRMNSGYYPQNVCSVVYQRNYKQAGCQFTWACRKDNRIASQLLYEEAVVIAESVMLGFHQDVSLGATSFNNRPFRDKGLKQTAKIGNHYFYKNTKLSGS